ncbi:30S ribosomal protein S19 [Candidatus Phytoplasma melaleucae]|uniref:Small ribosomal subunit protein uS19 n=1 Tax=Candidatus Phytoplasma melaleucae TaxID=2982630 RepID=A0ABT9DDJ0_9MOLU|nr:30S ribosomal protein S19 ['Melaleuca sp.' phytoplasma]MDO8168123.1 30S ribosomal protein S19 ['Melaleuca sp.' phytoplasma]MDV3205249.1 30S ribosomal protein S19 [Weeping tea tree witches'-broom phytoplasma]
MARSIKKGSFADEYLLLKIRQQNENKTKKLIQTRSRRTNITPEFVGHRIAVHNGREYIPIFITEDMVGFKLGSLTLTRKVAVHAKKDKKITKHK